MNKLVRIILILFLVALGVGITGAKLYADTTSTSSATTASSSGSWPQPCQDKGVTGQDCVNFLSSTVSSLQGQEKTLSSQIAVMDSQIELTQARINATKQQIMNLTLSIQTANSKITTLQSSINDLTKVLLNRIVATYEVGQSQPFQILVSSNNISNFFTRENYLKIAQAHDKQLMYDTVQAKNDYANQKNIYETQKKQVEQLNAQLQQYTAQLDQEKTGKQQLLTETQGSEANYQQQLAAARAQLAAFSSYVTSQGGVSLITADPNWPTDYYSQRDTRWGNVVIGGYYSSPSNETTIGESGCLISSVAMVVSKRGNTVTPLSIGTTYSYFFDANFNWSSLESLGFNQPMFSSNTSIIDNSLAQGKWVIVGLSYYAGSHYPFHFVVITSKNGNDYNLYDPWRGPNISLNNNYGNDYITEIITY